MGICKSKSSKRKIPPDKSFSEHKVTKHHLRLGVQAGKDEKGEIIVGVKAGLDNFRDVEVVVGENKIPSVKELVEDGTERTKVPKVPEIGKIAEQ